MQTFLDRPGFGFREAVSSRRHRREWDPNQLVGGGGGGSLPEQGKDYRPAGETGPARPIQNA